MKRYSLSLLLFCTAVIVSYSCKQSQTHPETAESTSEDSVADVAEEPYNLEAIAKVIEGCTFLYRFENGVASMEKDDERVYFDLHGRRVERPKDEVDPNALKAQFENGMYGFVDGNGKLVIPHRYHFAVDFSDGMALVCNENGEIGYVNTEGELVIPYKYDNPAERNGNDFHEGLCAVMVDVEHEWFSYIDKTGKLAFPGVFSHDGDFSEGLAAVTTTGEDGQSGYIDHSGKMVITLPKGWRGRKFRDGVAQIQNYDSCFVIDKTGKRLFPVDRKKVYIGDDIVFSDGLAVVIGRGQYEKKWGFMDKTGRITFCLDEE